MSGSRSVAVRIEGQEYRIRSEGDDEGIQRVARYVDATMKRIRERTRTVDSRDVAVLSALNIAKDLLVLKDAGAFIDDGFERIDPSRVKALIDLIEAAEHD
jgi:cell division protein ZapA